MDCFPQKDIGHQNDITRDYGWQALSDHGFKAVSIISIDDTWSAFRFKSSQKSKTGRQASVASSRKIFSAVIEKPHDGMDTAYISIPFNVEKMYGTKGQIKVKASFDDYPYRGILTNMGTGSHIIIVRKDIRAAIGKNVGNKIKVILEQDLEERTVEIPTDLKKALSKDPAAKTFFDALSFTNRKEYATWISSAKKTETREKRLTDTIKKLLLGQKNPSQK